MLTAQLLIAQCPPWRCFRCGLSYIEWPTLNLALPVPSLSFDIKHSMVDPPGHATTYPISPLSSNSPHALRTMPPQEVDMVMSAIQVDGGPRDDFTGTSHAAQLCDPDSPFHAILESIKTSSALPPQQSVSTPTSPSSVMVFQASSDIGNYAASVMTTTDTMVTWQPTESVVDSGGEPFVVEAPTAEDDRPDTPIGPRIGVLHQSQGFETPKRQVLAGLADSSRSRSTPRLDGMIPPMFTPKKETSVRSGFSDAELQEPEPYDGTLGKKCCQFIHSVRNYAWKNGKRSDLEWIAGYAGTRFTDDALAWHSRQPPNVRDDWNQLESALLETFYPGYRNGSTSTPSPSPGATSSSRTAFSPSGTTSPASSDGPQSPPMLSPDLSSSTLVSPSSGSVRVRAPSQSSPRSLMMSSHISLASESSQRLQCGQLMIVENNGRSYYLRIRLSRRGGCKPTSDKSESLRVRNATGTSRRLYLDNSSSHYAALGIAWCIKRSHTPHLNKGSFDCADLVYLDNNGASSSKDAHGPSRDAIWTVKDDNSVQVFWLDNEKIEHELHAVMKPEPESFFESLMSPARIVLVKDPDAFIPQNPGYVRSRFVFEP